MIEANTIDQSVYDAINEVRERPSVSMPPIPAGQNRESLRTLVRKERLYELAMEGFRMVDLRRWGLAEKMIAGTVYGRIPRSEEHTSELQSLMRNSYAVFCLKKKKHIKRT